MKTLITIGVVTAFALISLLVVLMCSMIGISAIDALMNLFDFAWGTTFHAHFSKVLITVDDIVRYWVRFLWIVYIPAVIFVRVKYIEKILKKF